MVFALGYLNMTKTEWRLETLPENTHRALDYLSGQQWLAHDGWYLAGGTALALQVGHRQSVDLDFFLPQKTFVPNAVTNHFSGKSWEADIVQDGTVYGTVHRAKVSFIAYPFFIPALPKLKYGSVEILDKDDIAVMKVIAISQRGRKRDFIDLYWYVNNIASLISVIEKLPNQYPEVAHNFHHIIKSLTYFDDADKDPVPMLLFDVTWDKVKSYFRTQVPLAAKKLLHLG